jgi:hypothetical protein
MAKVGSALEWILFFRFSAVVSFRSIFRWDPELFRLFPDLLLTKLRIDLALGRWVCSETAAILTWIDSMNWTTDGTTSTEAGVVNN